MITLASEQEKENRNKLLQLFKKCPIPDDQLTSHLGLFIKRQDLSRMLFLHKLYKKIVNLQGIIIEFGTYWGQNMVLFESLRGIYEPYNYGRKIVGFDTFEGFIDINKKDGNQQLHDYSTTQGYEKYLELILQYHESESPLPHIKKFEIIKGDASKTITKYLNNNPETLIALAYFDFDLYQPTLSCLRIIKTHLVKGAIVGFDELGHHDLPGETQALREVFGQNFKLHRDRKNSLPSYIKFK